MGKSELVHWEIEHSMKIFAMGGKGTIRGRKNVVEQKM